MKLQILVSTMHRTDHSLLEKMNIQSDAVVINQCDREETETFLYNGHSIKWISVKDRGIGKSRNLAIENSDADIILFADDDVVYDDGMAQDVIRAFEEHKNSDIIVFNLELLNKDNERPEFMAQQEIKIGRFNFLRYGATKIAVRTDSLRKHKLRFSLLFGGGAKYQCGEDNLFLIQAIKAGMNPIAVPVKIGCVKQEESTWFKGYNEKYFYDRGVLFGAMFGLSAPIYLLLIDIKNNSRFDIPFFKRYTIGLKGTREYKELEER
ncbi:MAG: glycosyltransferase family 2 protein [Clostridium sp.]|nr:glycosyltransferase family 2 protein [Clostridium sp.]